MVQTRLYIQLSRVPLYFEVLAQAVCKGHYDLGGGFE
jgi:hypothetical protein